MVSVARAVGSSQVPAAGRGGRWRLERRVGLDLGAALRALPRSWALCPGKWEVTAKFKKGSDMMKIIFWNNNSFLAVGTLS